MENGYDLHKQYVIKQENIIEDRDLADDDAKEEAVRGKDLFVIEVGINAETGRGGSNVDVGTYYMFVYNNPLYCRNY